MRNFLKQTFQPKADKNTIKNSQNISKEKIIPKTSFPKKQEKQEISNKAKEIKLKPKISQEIMNTNLSLLGIHPTTQNLKKENKDKEKENKEKLNLKNIKETFIKKNNEKDDKNVNNNNTIKEYKQPYKPLAHYIIDKNLRFDENKSKNKINLDKNKSSDNKEEFNSDEEDELIQSKRRKINLALNESKKRDKIYKEKMAFKKSLNSLINDDPNLPKEEKTNIKLDNPNKKKLKKSVSGNFVRLNLKKKYQEKKRFRPVKLRKITLNHSKELYKYQKKNNKKFDL